MAELVIKTSWGDINVTADEGRVTRCSLPHVRQIPSRAFKFGASRIEAGQPRDRRSLQIADRFIRSLFDGGKAGAPPLRMPDGGPFAVRAWVAMRKLRRGQVISYAELASRAGSPRALRAAGQACARNDIPLFIPCHRVLGSGGQLGGFSCGLAWKKLLLARETSLAATRNSTP
jgi:methylated-DNA-[protein]-cysteine S-methyltransferase